jgi:carboxylesterase type B
MTEVQHPALGTIKGTVSGGVVEYLGIQYATLAHQFAPPVAVDLSENQSDRVLNATNYGWVKKPRLRS